MTASTSSSPTGQVFRQAVLGSRRLSNLVWAIISAIGGVGFFLAGLSSYLHKNLLIVSDTTNLIFFPQGVALLFYGLVGSAIALYQMGMFILDVGGGYNEFNKAEDQVTIFRWGFPGKNRQICVTHPLDAIQAVRAEIREGINPKRMLYLRVKASRDIPLTRVGEPLTLTQLENQGAELARFLEVPLEGL